MEVFTNPMAFSSNLKRDMIHVKRKRPTKSAHDHPHNCYNEISKKSKKKTYRISRKVDLQTIRDHIDPDSIESFIDKERTYSTSKNLLKNVKDKSLIQERSICGQLDSFHKVAKERERVNSKYSLKNMSKILRSKYKQGKGRSSTSSFRDLGLNAVSGLKKNAKAFKNDKEKVPISDEQIDHMITRNMRRFNSENYDEAPITYEEKLMQSKYSRSTQKY
ncbi:unnamed protein product [Moneuplotes crassus]|uniref:Uncharacterized protein n=1 Tax=Euplotes crassus TaxID=5936 RepID=A0AAD1UCH4_EUPCR|nr:unnamed protein product [Moneuplotes crassus]